MFESIRHRVLRFARVPAEPHPPLGAPGSVRVFRAGRNYYNLCLLRWGVAQIGAVIGIVFSLWFLDKIDLGIAAIRAEQAKARAAEAAKRAAPPAAVQPAPAAAPTPDPTLAAQSAPTTTKAKANVRRNWKQSQGIARSIERWPAWVFPVLHWVEYGAILLFICQIPVTYAAARLEFEQHWYIVTDRSLRIRTGLFSLQESTMSFANLQQVEVQQGPLQRMLGLANLRVQSAGGGAEQPGQAGNSLHTGVFHGVENANEIRDLILERLRRFRQAGLGDPDDAHASPAPVAAPTEATSTGTLAAAQELLAEARALRAALG